MIAYASRTGTKRNLAELRRYGWRLLVSSTGDHRTEGFPYAIDNGAWHAHTSGKPWDEGRFVDLVEALGAGADWIVAPDIVEGGRESLALSERWLPRLPGLRLLAVQDGFVPADVQGLLGAEVGIFVGGSTDWKLATLGIWGALAREVNCWCHVGRVNTVRRIHLCAAAGATSFDGSGASRFASIVRRLDLGRRQAALFFDD